MTVMIDETELEQHFEFGKNWQSFLEGISEERLNAAVADISNFLGPGVLKDRSFVDVGCGSGLSSLAAYKLGAARIFSCDIDPINIENVKLLKGRYQIPDSYPWDCEVRSIVSNDDLPHILGGEVVYAWGVLHHTGAMWSALSNASALVEGGGYFYLMLYRDAKFAQFWKFTKKLYVKAPTLIQFVMRNVFAAILISGMLVKLKNPFKSIKNYGKNSRGMSWYTDVTDWIGGYPFEYAEAEEVISFLEPLGFDLVKIEPPIIPKPMGLFGTGSYQYLFRKST